MDRDKTEPDPSHHRNGIVGLLYGEFTDILNGKVRCSVSLTDHALTVQKITSSPGQGKVVFDLNDCIGCRAFKGEDNADTAAYFSAYFYPFKRKWLSSATARQRLEQSFRVALAQDPSANLEEAERWARAIRDASFRNLPRRDGAVYCEVRRPCRLMLLLNPNSGRGQAMSLFTTHVQRMLTEAAVPHTLVITEHQNHARELVRKADLSQWDALVILSGDGLLFEVVNGLMEREDWEVAVQTPLGILPGGSGNALAASVNHYSGAPMLFGEELLVSCGFLLCKGLLSPLDLVSVHLASGQRLFSFLSLAWGFVADVDIESERYRQAGALRFLLGTLVRLASLRTYRGRLAFLPVHQEQVAAAAQEGRAGRAAASTSTVSSDDDDSSPYASPPDSPSSSFCSAMSCGPLTDSSPPCSALCPENSVHNGSGSSPSPNNDNKNTLHNASNNAVQLLQAGSDQTTPLVKGPPDSLLPPLDEPVPAGWTQIAETGFVLVLAMCQSYLAEDLQAAPEARPQDGCIHLYYVLEGVSRAALLRLFLAMEKGTHMDCGAPQLVYRQVRALRLEPLSAQGALTVDGEQVECGPVQAQVHAGLARLMSS
ncbi:sphingosine kinase 1-like [Sardina pilchardus]|uniref:sphingosine kinase 1-like n=1 Tax=Sardina pilchardus TaxID=27697 RepID=UPI002E127AC8